MGVAPLVGKLVVSGTTFGGANEVMGMGEGRVDASVGVGVGGRVSTSGTGVSISNGMTEVAGAGVVGL